MVSFAASTGRGDKLLNTSSKQYFIKRNSNIITLAKGLWISTPHALLIIRPFVALTPASLTATAVVAGGIPITFTVGYCLTPAEGRGATLHTLVMQTFLADASSILAAGAV